jgi:FeS assembly protein IscX
MKERLTWTSILEIAENLFENHPDVDPRNIRFTDLHKWVTEIPSFEDDPKASNERILEAIQMAWIEEWEED